MTDPVCSTMAFGLTVAPILLAPGTSTLLVGAQSLRDPRSVPLVISGDLTANAGQLTVVGGVLATLGEIGSPVFVGALKWIGVAYLLTLSAARLRGGGSRRPRVPTGRAFLRGFLVSAVNPKAIVFLAGLFPAFLETGQPLLPQMLLLGGIYLLLDGICLTGYAVAARSLAGSTLRAPGGRADRLAGGLLLLAAVLLALK